MARRRTVAYDRLVTLALGLGLLAVATVAAARWWRESGRDPWPYLPDRVDLTGVHRLLDQAWWPWAALGAGTVLVLLGIAALLLHLPRTGPSTLRLPGSGPHGRLEVDAGQLADGAAALLAGVPGVRRSTGRVVRDRDGLVTRLRVTLDPRTDLAALAEAGDRMADTVRDLTGRGDLRCEVLATVSSRAGRRAGRARPAQE